MTNAEAQRRQHILSAAERLLRHYGPAKTTIADIAKEADVGVGTVYLEFMSKEAIIEELSRSWHTAVIAAMRSAAGGAARYSERLRAVFDARLESFLRLAEQGAHARDLVHCVRPCVQTAHSHFEAAERALLIDFLRAGTQARELAVKDLESTALTLQRAYSSFAPPRIFGQPVDEVRRLHAAMHELVLNGLLERPLRRSKRSAATSE
jgi:AcrR family transcriptional regulator